MIPELAIWIIAAGVAIIAIPPLLVILVHVLVGVWVGVMTLYETVKEMVTQ